MSERPSWTAACGRGDILVDGIEHHNDGEHTSWDNGEGIISGIGNGPRSQLLHQSRKDRSAASIHADSICFSEVGEITFDAWPAFMLRQILASRAPFSFFLKQCILKCRGFRDEASTALFPLPFPRGELWRGKGLKKLGVSRRARLAIKRSLFLVVATLNYMHFQCPLKLIPGLWRRLGPCHERAHARLIALIRASGTAETFSFLGCGRKTFQLDARLNELQKALQSFGVDESSFYMHVNEGTKVPPVNDRDELRPYRPLDASRLKLSGQGTWDCRQYLSDLLLMPFVEPVCNQYNVVPPQPVLPDLSRTSAAETVKLCKVWDAQGLLRIFPKELVSQHSWGYTKVFNNYKSELVDRQIGDRRGQNFTEGKILNGPSHNLPTAAALLDVCPKRYQQCLVGSVADRKDFYHQFWVTDERARTNVVFPPLSAEVLRDTAAFRRYEEQFVQKKRSRDREVVGDNLHKPAPLLCSETSVVGAFAAIFQGDHLGVEFATDAHATMLQTRGLLQEDSRLQSSRPVLHDDCVSGLVIDDFFVVSKEELQDSGDYEGAESVMQFWKAKKAYREEGLLGSDGKDVIGKTVFTVCGGEVFSEESSVRRGVVSLGAPYKKRMSLAMITAAATSLPSTTDALWSSLVGAWISTLLLRRPAMAVLDEAFKVIPPDQLDAQDPQLWFLSRQAASELQQLACLSPILCSNLSVPVSHEIFATDASLEKGGIVKSEVSEEEATLLWRSAPKVKSAAPVLSRTKAMLSVYDPMFEEIADSVALGGNENALGCVVETEQASSFESEAIPRPIGLSYEFIEVCGGAAVVTKELLRLGVVCGPVIDVSISKQFDLRQHRVIEWIIFLMEEDRLMAFLVSPPCTTFSPAAHPCMRSYSMPRGFDQSNPKVRFGNQLAFASLTLMMTALRLGKFGLLEQPRRSKMRWLQEWQRLLELGAKETFTASCMFGSIHQKEFALLGANMHVELLHRACSRDHQHVVIQGKLTKPSATYCDGLALAFAIFFRDHIQALKAARGRLSTRTEGLEDLLSNDVCIRLPWKVHSAWQWEGRSHINVLELAAVVKLMRDLAKNGGDRRQVVLVDSQVVVSVLRRGRSSAASLKGLLKKACAISLAHGIYIAPRYVPTRLNPADCPTRDYDLPEPGASIMRGSFDLLVAQKLSLLGPFRRWISNWVRLVLFASPAILLFPASARRHCPNPINLHEWTLDFDSTLGFPGEGPHVLWIWVLLFLTTGKQVSSVGVGDASHGDAVRRERRTGIQLDDGRRVTENTANVRDVLFERFEQWLVGESMNTQEVLFAATPDLDRLNKVLVKYGRWLFSQGKPLYHFSETVNAISSRRPMIRRSLQQTWDLAFMWASHEPTTHHVAMPHQVLVAVLAAALYWGWSREAAVFAMSFGMLLRIGEVLEATRADLILPSDIDFTNSFALLRIKEPKTRYRAARHQSGRLDQPDLLEIVRIGFGRLKPNERLWPLSGATLRSRLMKILAKLDLPTENHQQPKPMSLASFRPGGATYMMTVCDNAEQIRRKGRWASQRIMEIYLQEVMASTYLNQISEESKQKILLGMKTFPQLLAEVIRLDACQIPATTWYFLLRQQL